MAALVNLLKYLQSMTQVDVDSLDIEGIFPRANEQPASLSIIDLSVP